MITTKDELLEALAKIVELRSDHLDVEAKLFREYSPASIGPTLSSFANLSGGGTILLGIDESLQNPIVGVPHAADFIKQAQSQARKGFSVPISITEAIIQVGGRHVVALNVHEAHPNDKPVLWKRTKKAYIRSFDGDYTMSKQEEQQLIIRHSRPRADGDPVPGTSVSDLNPTLLQSFLDVVRHELSLFANASDEEILLNLNVVTSDGELTIAGLYALGTYPQRYLPNLMITAAVEPPQGADRSIRALHRKDFVGPIPQMLADATQWVIDHSPTALAVDSHGYGMTHYTFPPDALREAIANALVHRDLSEATRGKAVELRLNDKEFRLTNPGGLWEISIDSVIAARGKSAVNDYLYTICRYVHGPRGRVIEALGSGIRTMLQALQEADLEKPYFFDNSVSFTVKFPRHSTHSTDDLAWLTGLGVNDLTASQREALLDMRRGVIFSNGTYRKRFSVDSAHARAELQDLVKRGIIVSTGERRGTRYHLPDA